MGWFASLGGAQAASNGAAVNVADGNPNRYIDVLKSGTFSGGFTLTQLAAAQFDDNQYPTQTFTGVMSYTFPPGFFANVPYRFIWAAGTKGQWTFVGSNTSTSKSGTGGSFTGGTGNNLTITVDGTGAGYVTFTPSSLSLQFVGTGPWGSAGTAQISLVRDSDVTNGDYGAGKIFTREYIALLQGLNPKTLRVMGQMLKGNGSENNQVKWKYRTQTSHLSWGMDKVFSDLWAGGYGNGTNYQITGTDQLTANPGSAMGLGAWVNGETVQGQILNDATKISISGAVSNGGNVQLTVNSTTALSNGQSIWVYNVAGTTEANGIQTVLSVDSSTLVTLNVPFVHTYVSGFAVIGVQTFTVTGKSGGTKFICSTSGIPVRQNNDSFLTTSGIGTFVYDVLLDRVRFSPQGVHGYTPASILANLANSVGANLWATIPWYAEDDWVTQWSTEIRDNLLPRLYLYPEWGNENGWSFQFPASQWMTQVANRLGFGGNPVHFYSAFRTRQVMEIIGNVWSGRKERMRRVLAYQGSDSSANTLSARLKGTNLKSSTSGGAGNPTFDLLFPGVDYTTSPNRPIDFCEVIAYAPYAGGTNYNLGTDITNGSAPTADNQPFFQSVITAVDNGDMTTAKALVDWDIRKGRTCEFNVTASGATFTTVDGGGTPTAHGWSARNVCFDGSLYSGITKGAMYRTTILSTTTFSIQAFSNQTPTGSAVNAGTAGGGTMTVGIVGRNTANVSNMLAQNSLMYPGAEFLASAMDGDRPNGLAAVRTEQYEGNLEPQGPALAAVNTLGTLSSSRSNYAFTADGTSGGQTLRNIPPQYLKALILGGTVTGTAITGSPTISAIDFINGTVTLSSTAINASVTAASFTMSGTGVMATSAIQEALLSWKEDALAAATQTLYFQQSMGQDPNNLATYNNMLHARTPSQLVLLGGGNYALVSGPGINDPKWQMYYGFSAFNSGAS